MKSNLPGKISANFRPVIRHSFKFYWQPRSWVAFRHENDETVNRVKRPSYPVFVVAVVIYTGGAVIPVGVVVAVKQNKYLADE